MNNGHSMSTRVRHRAAGALACVLPMLAAGQSNIRLTLDGPAGNVARWGSAVSLRATLGADCASAALAIVTAGHIGGIATLGPSSASVPCIGGRLGFVSDMPVPWFDMPSDWQTFRASATLVPGTSGNSNFQSVRFDPEYDIPYGGSRMQLTIAGAASGYQSCTGHDFRIIDREAARAPMPPPNVRTPHEMFQVVTSTCDNGQPTLVNVALPAGYNDIWVYDKATGTPAWRRPLADCRFRPPCPLAPPGPGETLFAPFARAANIPVYGDAAGVQALIAFSVYQEDFRATDLQDLWWAGPSESGWGLNIAKSGEKLFVSGFIYDGAGRATWVYMPEGRWDPVTQVWFGDLYSPLGARYGAYNSALLDVGASIGTGSLSFNTQDTGHFDYTIHGASGGKSISRYVFGPRPGNKPGRYTGIWWGLVEQNGWGLAVSHQGDTVFATWYTYDDDFKATWFFMPEGRLTPSGTYAGALYRTKGDAWAGQHYKAESTHVTTVGTMELRFGDDKPGTMTAIVNGQVIVNPLARFAF